VISGGRTGIVGGAVAQTGGALLSLDSLKAEPVVRWSERLQCHTATVAAGLRLEELQERLRRGDAAGLPGPDKLFYPVDPTEVSATLGGTAATNASGARTLRYGPTRQWVESLTVVLADGSRLRVARGESRAAAGRLRIAREGGGALEAAVSAVPQPATKHTAGYLLGPDMDLIDLFIGGEGTLAIVTEVEVRLLAVPARTVGLCVFARSEQAAEQLVAAMRAEPGLAPTALEYMDAPSLDLLRAYRDAAREASGVPQIPDAARAVLYVEASFGDEADVDGFVAALEKPLAACGISADDVWAGFEPQEIQAMKKFRHALPERINALVSERKRALPELTKIGTDMAVGPQALGRMMAAYREGLEAEGLEHYTFGHIGNGHVHVNIVPRTADEMARGKALYREFARTAVALGGSVAGEHGIGRLKREFMRIQYDDGAIAAMRRVKEALDPAALLNPGVMLPD
jgi:D-lactate dehydrogenase (cytochrome)